MSTHPTWSDPATTADGPTLSTHLSVLPPEDDAGTDPAATPATPPRRFQLSGRLGAGGLGEVFAAVDRDIGRSVAIKRVRPDRAGRGIARRFVQEVRTIGALDHPAIVPIYDVGRDDDGALFFVMKHVRGETVEDLIARLRAGDREAHAIWTIERRVDAFLFLCRAVAYAHRQGVLHRDIKPANVMLGADGQVQLLDWGVAKALPEEDEDGSAPVNATRAGARIGTPRYMSPELARGEPADGRSETWALCMLLYEWLTLTHPFEDAPDAETLFRLVQERPIPSPTGMPRHPNQPPVPADLGWMLFDGLNIDPAVRFPTVDALIDRIERHLRGEVDVRCPVTLHMAMTRRTERMVARFPWLSVLGVLVLFGLAATAVASIVAGIVLVVT